MTTFATAEDFAEYKGLPRDHYDSDATEKARVNAGLLSAQDDVAGVVFFSIYSTDDAEKTTALTRATCARFDYMEQTGDDGTGAAGAYDNVRIGSVSLAKSVFASSGKSVDEVTAKLGPKAAQILFNAGFLYGAVYHS